MKLNDKQFKYVADKTMEFRRKYKSLPSAGEPWVCRCSVVEFTNDFLSWLELERRRIESDEDLYKNVEPPEEEDHAISAK